MASERSELSAEDIHSWFSLTQASYFVMPRLAMEALPLDWQRRFIGLMDEAEAMGLETPSYHVFRQGDEFSRVERDDECDDTSAVVGLTVVNEDPWAHYRRASFEAVNGKPLDASRAALATPPAPSVPWEEQAARQCEEWAIVLTAKGSNAAKVFDRIQFNADAVKLRDHARAFRALLSKPAKGEGE